MGTDLIATRYAPSPTGKQHLGGARTALFAWLYARSNGGHFYLRLEDTDPLRSREEFAQDIVASLEWLGLDWDGDIVRQSENSQRYEAVGRQLEQQGQVYWCDCDPARLEELRQQARNDPTLSAYDGRCRDRGLTEAPGRAMRLRVTADMTVQATQGSEDLILGWIATPAQGIEDFVLRRSERTGAGGFTYHLCCVADDHHMGITHVIRGADHMLSVIRQRMLYLCLGWQVPLFAHLPLVLTDSGERLSKRQNATALTALRAQGYLPEAVINFLVRLGWSRGNEEFFADLDSLKAIFDLKKISKAPATADLTRLQHLNGLHVKHRSGGAMLQRYLQWRSEQGLPDDALANLNLQSGLIDDFLKRQGTFLQLHQALCELAEPPRHYADQEAAAAFCADDLDMLSAAQYALADQPETAWNAVELSNLLNQTVQQKGQKFAALGMPLRLALTGSRSTPGVEWLCAALGRQQVLERLDRILNPTAGS